MKQVLKCTLVIETKKGKKDGKMHDNLILTTCNDTQVQVKLAFYNSKLMYKLKKEIENAK